MSSWWWVVAAAIVLALLALDLLVFHRHAEKESTRRALLWSVIWVSIGLAFSLLVAGVRGWEACLEYLTAFLVEKALSVDNLFVFIALFSYFAVEPQYHHRVLFWGILGAIVTRGLFIFGGVALLAQFHWLLYVLGGLLVVTGARLAFVGEEVHPERNRLVRWASRVLPLQRSYHGEHFLVKTDAGWRFTPLILVLIAIESTDVMFAVDSVPAVLAVSRDSFVVYTSNIFAILGLRALYFVLAGALRSLRFLKPALVAILVLVGVKMLITDFVKVPVYFALGTVAVILTVATVASLVLPQPDAESGKEPE
ncbi:MAG TPA: TerC/Alx family metal homeostasis membrane protein [Polyangia bacterium]